MKHENLESLGVVKLLAFSMIDLTLDVNKTRIKMQGPHRPHITLQVKKKKNICTAISVLDHSKEASNDRFGSSGLRAFRYTLWHDCVIWSNINIIHICY